MKLHIDGNINPYFVQMLCMIFFPGTEFGKNASEREGPELSVRLVKTEDGAMADALLSANGKTTSASCPRVAPAGEPFEKTAKFAVGGAVLLVGAELLGYRPPWGMLTGVRPSKVVRELLEQGISKTRVQKILTGEYRVLPKKAQLAINVALNEQRILGVPSEKDCSVYISIPFCPTRCAYCSFVSYTSGKLLSLIPEYLIQLCEEIREIFREIHALGLHTKTVYIGGGTPTTLTADELRCLLSTIAECTDVGALEEFTLEAGRPDTITKEKMQVAHRFGVTRVSVNPQTLSQEVLEEIGRKHTAEDFFRAFEIVREAGIPVINTDLIVGLPGDNFRRFSETMDRVLELDPENLTVHTFCVKKASDYLRNGSNVYSLRGGDAGKCVDYAQLRAVLCGYKPYYMYRQKNTVGNYENVGFSKEGSEGRYNVYMMEEVHSIFAAGAGAVSKMVHYRVGGENGEPRICRVGNPKYPYEYLRAPERIAENMAKFREFYETRRMLGEDPS